MKPPALSLALPADATAIALMSRTLIEDGLPGWSWDPHRVERAIRARETAVVVVAPAAGYRTIGGFAIMDFGDERAHLSLLAVLPSQQRRGLGSRLLAWLETSALVAGIGTITLELRESNRAARDFYLARGFTESAYLPGYYQRRESALRMSRDIRRRIGNRIA